MFPHPRIALLLLAALFGVSLSPAHAQAPTPKRYEFRQLAKPEGLSQVSVFAIEQDRAGFLWFGTRDGLNRYDGYNFRVYRSDSTGAGPAGDDLRTIYQDPTRDQLWIGTLSGLSRYDPVADAFDNYRPDPTDSAAIPSPMVSDVLRDRGGRLWVATGAGLALFDEASGRFTRLEFDDRSSASVRSLLEDRTGTLWVGTLDGLYRLKSDGGAVPHLEPVPAAELELPDARVHTLTEDASGDLWIGTATAGVHRWSRRTRTLTSFSTTAAAPDQQLADDYVRASCLGPDGQIWVGTFDGVSIIDPASEVVTTLREASDAPGGLSDGSVHALFADRRGGMWIGTYYGGANHYDPSFGRFQVYKHYPYQNSLGGPVVSAFAEDERAGLWIGTEGGGLDYLDPDGRFTHYRASDSANALSGNNVKALLLDDEHLWAGTYNAGLSALDLGSGRFRQYRAADYPGLTNDNVYALLGRGPYVYALTHGGGLSVLDVAADTFALYQHSASQALSIGDNRGRVALATAEGEVYIGTERGLDRVLLGGQGMPRGFEHVLADCQVYALHEDAGGQLWVGTLRQGLAQLDPATGRVRWWTEDDGLPGNAVYGILPGDDGRLWLSTNAGLTGFDPRVGTAVDFDYTSGPEVGEYNTGAYFRTRGGELLFGGTDGFTRFDPADIRPDTFLAPVAFTGLRQNGLPVRPDAEAGPLPVAIDQADGLTFGYGEANFSLGLSALDFNNPGSTRFSYRLEGLDRDWTESSGETELTYTLQREGDYLLRVRTSDGSGGWNPAERTLAVTVLPPPWRTGWAYAGYLLTLLVAAWLLYRLVNLRHALQLQRAEQARDEELHEVRLRFFTNVTHEFRTPLTLLLAPLRELRNDPSTSPWARGKLAVMERSGERLLNLVNQVLTFRRLAADHEPVVLKQGELVSFLEDLCTPFRENAPGQDLRFTFVPTVDELRTAFDAEKLEQVFTNLLGNAFKFTPAGGRVTLSVECEPDGRHALIRVADNGPGVAPELRDQVFQRFYEKSVGRSSLIKGTGIGLAISRQFVALHDGTLNVDDAPGGGAVFSVRIPVVATEHAVPPEVIPTRDGGTAPASVGTEPGVRAAASAAGSVPQRGSELVERGPSVPLARKRSGDAVATRPRLLIVEDNAELASYLEDLFDEEYVVAVAEDGVAGLKLAGEHSPDLILSDVMMPEMDGLELCRRVKSDLATSHVPVILLTAREADAPRLTGLGYGADDYLQKPFHPEELRLRVRNVIAARVLAREKFTRVVTLDPHEVVVTSADEKFLAEAIATVEAEIDNPDFSANQFADALAVSRALLFTKIKALTGQTPMVFVKTVRLKRATQLLATGKLNVSEIAYRVGYRDPKYFQKSFKGVYGVSPSKWEA